MRLTGNQGSQLLMSQGIQAEEALLGKQFLFFFNLKKDCKIQLCDTVLESYLSFHCTCRGEVLGFSKKYQHFAESGASLTTRWICMHLQIESLTQKAKTESVFNMKCNIRYVNANMLCNSMYTKQALRLSELCPKQNMAR